MSNAGQAKLIVGSQGGKFCFFDAETLERLGELNDIRLQPHEVSYDPLRRVAYVGIAYRSGGYGEENPKGHEIAVIDVDAMKVTGYIEIAPHFGAHDVEYDPHRDLLYAGVESVAGLPGDNRNGLVIIDPEKREVVGNIPTKAPNTHWISLTAAGRRAYLAHKEYEAVSVLDLEKRCLLEEIAVRGGTEEIAASPDGRWVYAATPKMSLFLNLAKGEIRPLDPEPDAPTPALIKIDTATNTIVDRLEFQELLAAVWVASEGKVFVTEYRFPESDSSAVAPGRVHIIDGDSFKVLYSVECDELPFTTRTTSGGERAFVTNLKTGTVTVVDVLAGQVTHTLDINTGGLLGGVHPLAYVPAES